MLRLAFILVCIIGCYFWGDLYKWQQYYSTILFVVIGDLVYNCLFTDFPLWTYDGYINHTFSNLIVSFTVFPCVINVFLTHYPAKMRMILPYILSWSVLLWLVEYTAYRMGGFSYGNGWTVFWSLGFYPAALFLIRLHYLAPLAAWPVSALCALATMLFFKLPFALIK